MNDQERLEDALRKAARRQRDRARRAAVKRESAGGATAKAAGGAADGFTFGGGANTGACHLRYPNGTTACKDGLRRDVCEEAAAAANAQSRWDEGKSCGG